MTQEELRDAAERIRWYHTMDLGHGIVTRGESRNLRTLPRLRLPPRLDGLSVLDIGAWDGFFSFEAERRGAARVLATDWFSWGHGGWGAKAGFALARRALGSRVEDREIDVPDLAPETVGVFDVVLFLGVLYHVRHPLLALERVASVTSDRLILETHVDLLLVRRPACAFYPGSELDGDPTNWFGPNARAVTAMLGSVGFRQVNVVWHPPFLNRLARAALGALRGHNPIRALSQGRLVVHARR